MQEKNLKVPKNGMKVQMIREERMMCVFLRYQLDICRAMNITI